MSADDTEDEWDDPDSLTEDDDDEIPDGAGFAAGLIVGVILTVLFALAGLGAWFLVFRVLL